MNLINSFYQKVEEGKKGNNMGIPSGFPKLDKYIYGIQRRFMSTVIADSGKLSAPI
jgi:replicative DNA helicase